VRRCGLVQIVLLTLPAVLVLVAGCGSLREHALARSVERDRARALRAIDVPKCEREGGHVQGVGMFGTPSCVKPFADAGKTCLDSSECLGTCVASHEAKVGDHVAGACQADTASLYGCFNAVEKGIVIAGICFD